MAEKRYGILYDSNACIGCQACSVACRAENKLPENSYRLQVRISAPEGQFPYLKMDMHRQSCAMCDNAPCVPVCPTGASYTNEDGINMVDESKCVGCGYCVTACPYDARFINPLSGVADKCTFCYENRVKNGELPACVSNCPTGALVFGDLNDPESEICKQIRKQNTTVYQPHLNTKPKLIVIPNRHGGDI